MSSNSGVPLPDTLSYTSLPMAITTTNANAKIVGSTSVDSMYIQEP
jgi:hypothetical protein